MLDINTTIKSQRSTRGKYTVANRAKAVGMEEILQMEFERNLESQGFVEDLLNDRIPDGQSYQESLNDSVDEKEQLEKLCEILSTPAEQLESTELLKVKNAFLDALVPKKKLQRDLTESSRLFEENNSTDSEFEYAINEFPITPDLDTNNILR